MIELKPASNQLRKLRIAVVNSHPIQYFAPLYAYLQASGRFEVTVLYCTDFSIRGGVDPGFKESVSWDFDLLTGYRSVFLRGANARTPAGFWSLICPQLWGEIRSADFDAVWVHGHQYAANLVAMLAAMSKRVPILIRCETHLGLLRSSVRRALRNLLIGTLYGLADRCLAIGTENARFYRQIGIPANTIFLVPYAVDNDRFIAASSITAAERASVRARMGVPPDKLVVLFASKFQARKHPEHVLHAAARLRDMEIDLTVLMVGSGEMSESLQRLAADLSLDNVIFPGFINQIELPKVYAASDVFVLPSEDEPWGLIVNEVMCAGLPIVISGEIGCAPDLVENDDNGLLFKAGDIGGLTDCLKRLLSDSDLRLRMGRRSRERIVQWGYARCLEGLGAATLEL